MIDPYVGSAAAAAVVLCITLYLFRRKWAVLKVRSRTKEQKAGDISTDAGQYGIGYDPCCDAFYGLPESRCGYREYKKSYDAKDFESIYFVCRGKIWLVELIKGQYSMSLGAEIGVYQSDKASGDYGASDYTVVSDRESPHISFMLRRGSNVILRRSCRQGHVSGYLPGECADRKELELKVKIRFRDREMRNSFYEALLQIGYPDRDVALTENTVSFLFGIPKSTQPRKHRSLSIWLRKVLNSIRLRRYQRMTGCFAQTIDKLDYIARSCPRLYESVIEVQRMDRLGRKRNTGS